jgi:DNA processing protein
MTKWSRLEKAILLSKAYTRSKLLKLYADETQQLGLFSGYSEIDLNYLFDIAFPNANIDDTKIEEARALIRQHENAGISIIDYFDERYPAQLREVDNAPFLLYALGNIANLNRRCIAVVGTRNASDFGQKASFTYSQHFAENGYCIVSGLALGIDTAAHKGALSGNGYTVAIMASSPNRIYPAENRHLADEILRSNGTLISEHPIGFPLYKHEFVQRNRLQSGMSLCSLIVESSPHSGSTTQAEWSYKQGRKIFVLLPDDLRNASDFFISGGDYIASKFKGQRIPFSQGISIIDNFLKSTG